MKRAEQCSSSEPSPGPLCFPLPTPGTQVWGQLEQSRVFAEFTAEALQERRATGLGANPCPSKHPKGWYPESSPPISLHHILCPHPIALSLRNEPEVS